MLFKLKTDESNRMMPKIYMILFIVSNTMPPVINA